MVSKRIFFLGVSVSSLIACSESSSNNYDTSWSSEDREWLLSRLSSSIDSMMLETDSLNDVQWNFKPSPESWSVAWVVEHLITHDELFSREVRVLSKLPVMIPQPDSLFASDEEILSYREITPQNTGTAPDYLSPVGRWCSKTDALFAYRRVRSALIDYVKNTDADFREYYTNSGRGPTKYRDLHQLMIISVAHTERHLQQIRNIKSDPNFPE